MYNFIFGQWLKLDKVWVGYKIINGQFQFSHWRDLDEWQEADDNDSFLIKDNRTKFYIKLSG